MPDILAQKSLQRSTRYRNIASILAPVELSLSPLGQSLSSIETVNPSNQEYFKFSISDAAISEPAIYELANLSMTSCSFSNY